MNQSQTHAYTPGLEVTEFTTVTKKRELPLPGTTLVEPGEQVSANTPILSADLPGELFILRIADLMGLDPEEVTKNLLVKPGQHLEQETLLCENKTFFGLFSNKCKTPYAGVVEFYTEINAHLAIRESSKKLSVAAYINGTVSEVEPQRSVTITTPAAFIQGIFGIGGETNGEIFCLPIAPETLVTAETLKQLNTNLDNKVLIGGSQFSLDAINKAATENAKAIITGSIDSQTLAQYAGFEIGVSITGDEKVPVTLIITEGFGRLPISSRILAVAKKFSTYSASVNGATQVRAGAIRPEVIIPLPPNLSQPSHTKPLSTLTLGTRVRLIRVPYFGQFGTITALPSTLTQIPTGALVRVLGVKLEDGNEIIVPRANVELI